MKNSGKKTNEEILINEFNKEQEKPIECRRLLEFESKNRKVGDFNGLKKDMNYIEYGEFYRANLKNSGGLTYRSGGKHIDEIRVDDPVFSSIIKVSLEWSFSPQSVDFDEEKLIDNKLLNAQLVTNSCQIITVPTNPDATFDFESALEEVN